MNKVLWIVLIVGVAVLVGVVVFTPQEPTATPGIIPVGDAAMREPQQPPALAPVPAPLPARVTAAAPAPTNAAQQQDIEPEPTEIPEQPPRENPTEKQFLLCEHIVSGVTQYGFEGEIRLINKGKKAVNGWSVTWEYSDGATLVDAEDVALSGNNPYTGEYLDWNADIKPGETVVFKITGLNGDSGAPTGVRVSGESCM